MLQKEPRLLRIGVLGAGPIAQAAHFDAIRKACNAHLYAICDAADDLLERMAVIHQPDITYNAYDALLADPLVDAIVIAVADQFHVALASRAIAAGKHVLVEKPLGVSVEECAALRDQLQQTSLSLQIGNNKRFDPGIAFAQRFIQQQIGQLQALKAWYYDSAFRYTMTDNLQPIVSTSAHARRPVGDPKADRQRYFLLTHGSHLVDTARFLGGPIGSVQARHLERNGAHCWFIAADFIDGSVGHLDLIIPIQGDFEEGFQVFGQYGSVRGQAYLPWYHKASQVECFSASDRQYHRVLGEDSHTYKLQLEGFARTILHGEPQHGASIEDGLAAVQALVAIARSSEQGRPIYLDTVQGAV